MVQKTSLNSRNRLAEKIKTNFIRTIPVMTGYLVLAIGFGILLQTQGLGFIPAVAMSVFIYAGSMQFVAEDLIVTGAGLATAALTTLMVNARHLFYGISMVDRYRDTGKIKPYLIFGLTDETYSLVVGDPDLDDTDLFFITLFDHLYWVSGTVIGALLGSVIPWDFAGIEFALTALFVSIVVQQWMSNKDHVPAIIGIVISVICLLMFGRDSFLIPSMAGIAMALWILQKVRPESAKPADAPDTDTRLALDTAGTVADADNPEGGAHE